MADKATILFVDDEERILRSLKMLFRTQYKVLTTTDGNEALEILKQEKVHVLVSDQRMPLMMGVDLLRSAKEISPDTMRLLLTGYSDLSAIVGSVNEGEIFRYVNKPWDNQEIKDTVAKAVEIALSLDGMSKTVEVSKADSGLGILVIDEDQETYKAIKDLVGDQCTVHWGTSLSEAFEIMVNESIAVVVSEVRIKDEDIMIPIKTLKLHYPDIVTLILTSFQDTKALIDLINQGQIYRFLPKPIMRGMLKSGVEAALRHYTLGIKAPQMLKRHQVEKAKVEETSSAQKISSTISGYLKRIRSRLAS